MKGLAKKTSVVTGAARGIGLATVRRLAEEGGIVHGLDLDPPEIDAPLDGVRWHQIDVSSQSQVEQLFRDWTGPIDILVNNAATIENTDIFSPDLSVWDRMLGNNLTSVWLMTHHAALRMREQGSGAIINVSSVDAIFGNDKRVGYAAAKGGILGLTKTTAKQLSPFSIRVNCIIPGAIATRLTPDSYISPRPHSLLTRRGQPAEVAAAIGFLASDDASFITGACLHVDGGAHFY